MLCDWLLVAARLTRHGVAMTAHRPPAARDRLIRLDRASNVRDLGGYATRSGASIRWGKLYRAGELVRITDRDIARLEELQLQLIYDLRTSGEREGRPARPWGAGVRRLSRDYAHSGADLPSATGAAVPTRGRMRETMLKLYRTLPFDQADAFGPLLRMIAAGDLPLLFNCAGGKDRTGVFAALLLDLLGVSRDDIVADYLLSNDYLDEGRKRFLARYGRDDIDPDVWEPLLCVDAAYLDACFAEIADRHGGTAEYFTWLGLNPADITAIRAHLLEAE
jgi:protein-tyrosine phosphatase